MIKEIYKIKKIGSSDGYSGKILSIDNISEKRTGFLFESFGILDYNNSDLDNKIKDFVNNKLKLVFYRNSIIDYDSFVKTGEHTESYKHFELDLNLKWVDKLEIFAARGNKKESFILADIYTDKGKEEFPIYYDGKWKPSYELSGNKIKYFSIVIIYDKVTDVNDLIGIIKHEMKHGFDLFRDKFIVNHSNRDIIFFNNKLKDIKVIEKKPDNYRYFETKYWEYPEDDMKIFVGRLDILDFYKLFCDMIYYFNMSEITARLNNYKAEIERDKFNETSQTYRLYYGLRKILETFKRFISEKDKVNFANEYGKDFETAYEYDENEIDDRLKNKINKKRFYISFKHNGKYDEGSFDKICDFYINRLNKYFFKNADKIYSDIKNKYLI